MPNPPLIPPILNGTLLGIDVGMRRVGIATGHTQTRLAHAHSTLHKTADILVPLDLARLIKEWKPVGFIVGYPTHADHRETPHPLAALCINFAQSLLKDYGKPIALINEQLSSYAAEESYRQHHRTPLSKQNKSALDAYAAQHILQDFLDGSPPIQWLIHSPDSCSKT
jgi:putative holliday junction resolvase